MNAKADLQWNVLTIKRPGLVRDLPPGKEELMWVANSSTLICAERDAILVDTFLTTDQSQTLLDWVLASGTRSGKYWRPGSRFYGKTKQGEYTPELDALDRGYSPAGGTGQ